MCTEGWTLSSCWFNILLFLIPPVLWFQLIGTLICTSFVIDTQVIKHLLQKSLNTTHGYQLYTARSMSHLELKFQTKIKKPLLQRPLNLNLLLQIERWQLCILPLKIQIFLRFWWCINNIIVNHSLQSTIHNTPSATSKKTYHWLVCFFH
jgi:hypothetical protein